MKQILVIAFSLFFAFGCNDKSSTTGVKTTDSSIAASAPMENLDYPYTLPRPYQDWQPGDQKHALTVMKSLKAYENGDINGSASAFGDSAEIRFDGYFAKLSNDSLKKVFAKSRGELSAMKINMDDWESVISKDKKEEWVTLWYKQITTDKKGKTDSLSIINDLKIANGKIILLDEKIQHFPMVKGK